MRFGAHHFEFFNVNFSIFDVCVKFFHQISDLIGRKFVSNHLQSFADFLNGNKSIAISVKLQCKTGD